MMLAVAAPSLSGALLGGGLSAQTLAWLDKETASQRRRGAMFDGRSIGLDREIAATGGCSFDHGNTADRLVACLADVLGADDARPAILLIGDSHARDAYWTLGEARPDLRLAYLHHGGGCGVAKHRSLRIGGRLCYASLTEVFAALTRLRRIDGVALSTRYYKPLSDGPSYALRSLEARGALGASADLPMLLFGPSPSFNYALTRYITSAHPARALLAERGALPVSELHHPLHPARDAMRGAARSAGLYFADRLDAYCDAATCLVIDPESGAPLFADAEHLSRRGRRRLAARLADDPGLRAFLASVAGGARP